jgi:hypothetical protein
MKAAAPMFKLGRTSQAVPVETTLKASINTVNFGKGLTKIMFALSMVIDWTSSSQHQPHAQ